MNNQDIEDLKLKKDTVLYMGGEEKVNRLHDKGKLSVRERIDYLLDKDSFVEYGMLTHSQAQELKEKTPADGLVTGYGTINGRRVFVIADDPTVLGGSRGIVAGRKAKRMYDLAEKNKRPIINLMEAGAARLHEGKGATAAGLGERFKLANKVSGKIPQISALMGACYGGPSFVAMQSDFSLMVKGTSYLGMSGTTLVRFGVREDVTDEELGGSKVHSEVTGQIDYVAENEYDCLDAIKKYLSYFPDHCGIVASKVPSSPSLGDTDEGKEQLLELIPEKLNYGYNMEKIIKYIIDKDSIFYYKKDYAKNLITAFARIGGHVVGILANQPMFKAGALDHQSAKKARKFIELCDAYHIPLVFLQDCPGFIVGTDAEKEGAVSLASRLIHTVIESTTPKITIVIRKAIGLAYLALGGRIVDPIALYALPIAGFDVMGPEAGIEIAYGRVIQTADNPAQKKEELMNELKELSSAYNAAGMGLIDDIIGPAEIRSSILTSLENFKVEDPSFKHKITP